MIFARKINRIAEFYMIFARKMPEFYVIIAGKNFFFLFLGGGRASCPRLLYAYVRLWTKSLPLSMDGQWPQQHFSKRTTAPGEGTYLRVSFLETPKARRLDLGACGIIGSHENGFPGPAAAVDSRLVWLKIERTLLLTAYIVIDEVSNGLNDLSNI